MEYTDEQKKIIGLSPTPEFPLRVKAFAGTGKTTLLREYAKARLSTSMMYIAYNRALKDEAERTMPYNVRSKTIHSLAYAPIGSEYQKRKMLVSNVRMGDIMKLHGIKDYKVAYVIGEVIKNFCASADEFISIDHIPIDIMMIEVKEKVANGKFKISNGELSKADMIVDMAKDTWDAMKSLSNYDVGMTHDGYLKLYQLSGQSALYTDLILMDEAQDTTPCVWSIIKDQQAAKIIVGDEYQALYGWRGAVDFLSKVKTLPEFDLCLTKSFRFGKQTASLATSLLNKMRGEERVLEGNQDIDTEVARLGGRGCPRRGIVLCRSNAEIFRSALQSSKVAKIGIVGGSEGINLQLMIDIRHLMQKKFDEISNGLVKSFKSFPAFKNYVEIVGDSSTLNMCELVEKNEGKIHSMIESIRNAEVPVAKADIRFSTVHKAKGLEWPVVCIGRDMERILSNARDSKDTVLSDDFVNILYVALTRGTKKVLCPEVVLDFIQRGNEALVKNE